MGALKFTREGIFAFALAIVTLALDQWSKSGALSGFVHACPGFTPVPGGFCRIPLNNAFSLTMVWNPGMSFGLGRSHGDVSRWLFAVFAIGVAGVLAWYVRRTDKRLFATAAGLLIGGALGNVIDRFRYGAVVDFIDVSGLLGRLFPWIFNLADSAITVGAVILLLDAFLPSLRSRLDSGGEKGN